MKSLLATAAILISTVALATAQTGVVCHKTDEYTDVCKSTDGLITETTAYPDGRGSSLTYTPQEWKEHLARRVVAGDGAARLQRNTAVAADLEFERDDLTRRGKSRRDVAVALAHDRGFG